MFLFVWKRLFSTVLFSGIALIGVPSAQAQRSIPLVTDKTLVSFCLLDGGTVLTSLSTGKMVLWDAHSGKMKKEFGFVKEQIRFLVAADAPNQALGVVGKTRVLLLDIKEGKVLKEMKTATDVARIVAFNAGNDIACVGSDATIRIYAFANGTEKGTFTPPFRSLQPRAVDVSVSADMKIIAGAYDSITNRADKQIHVWDRTTGKVRSSYRIDAQEACSVHFHPKQNDTFISPGNDNRSICERCLKAGGPTERFYKLHANPALIRYSPDGSLIVAACIDNSISVFRGDKAKRLQLGKPAEGFVAHLVFSPDSKVFGALVFDSIGKIFCWNSDKLE